MDELYLIYDERYLTDPDRAIVLDTAKSLKQAKIDARSFPNSVIVLSVVNDKQEVVAEFIQK